MGARFLMEDVAVERVVYLGVDGALDEMVERWAEDLVGDDPTETGIWNRATRACIGGDAEQIDQFIDRERSRRRLRIFESFPDEETRVVEMLGGSVAVMVYDKAELNEEDMLPARLLVFGKGRKAVIKQVGQRWFLSPGSIAEDGVMTLEDREEGIQLSLFDRAGNEVSQETLTVSRGAKLRVSGSDV
jgi:hypothetical protein